MTTSVFTWTKTTSGSYTWVAPAGATAASIQCWAGGGGGGYGGYGTAKGGAGGGGGEYAAELSNTVVGGDSYTLTVGAGGVSGTSGSSTTFSGTGATTVTTNNGTHGGNKGGAAGAAGSGSANSVHHSGGAGAIHSSGLGGGGGGSSGGTSAAGNNGSVGDGGAGGAAVTGGGFGGYGGFSETGEAAGSPGGGGGGGGAGGSGYYNGGNGGTGQGIISCTLALPVTISFATTGTTAQWTCPAGVTSVAWSVTGTASFNGNSASGSQAVTPGTSYAFTVSAGGSLTISLPSGVNDLPQISPGATWLRQFKPGMPRLRVPVPPSFINQVQTSVAVTQAAQSLNVNVQAAPPPMDQPHSLPGATWSWRFQPGSRRSQRRRPPISAPPSGPYFGNQPNTSDQPQIYPGPSWLRFYKPGLPKPRPFIGAPSQPASPVDVTQAAQSLSAAVTAYPTGQVSVSQAPQAVSAVVQVPVIASVSVAQAAQSLAAVGHAPVVVSVTVAQAGQRIVTPPTNRDLAVLRPGSTWRDHFRPQVRANQLRIPGSPQFISTRVAVTQAAQGLNGQTTVYLPFPQFPLNLKYEILINGTWTDISVFVYQRDNQVIARGLPDETQSATPVSMTLTLNNRDGRFSPLNQGGAYFPYLNVNVQLRCSIVNQASATGVPYSGYRFWGELSSIPPAWDSTGNDIYCQVTVSGPLTRFIQGAKIGSALDQYYSGLVSGGSDFAPYAAWPAEDGSQATEIASLLPGAPSMTFTGTPSFSSNSAFGGSDPIPTISGSTWNGATEAAADPPGTGTITQLFPGTYTWTCPPGVTDVTGVLAIGGGGGGGDTDGTTGGGGGGGGGSQSASLIGVTAGTSYTYVVGPGGAPGASGAGTAGSPSMFTGDTAAVTGNGGAGGGYAGPSGAGGAGLGHNGGHGGSGSASSTSNSSSGVTGTTGASGGGTGAAGVSTTASWTAPSDVTEITVAAGGAGGGGGRPPGLNGSGAGGGGGYNSGTASVTGGSSYTFQAGNGGAGGNAGKAGNFGGNSGLAGQVVAGGGQGGGTSGGGGGSAGGTGGGGSNSGGSGGASGAGSSGNYGGGGGGGGSGAGPNDGGGGGANGSGRAPGAGSGDGGKGGWGATLFDLLPNGGQTAASAGTSNIGGTGGGGGGGGSSNGTQITGNAAGGGGAGWCTWSWSETGVPTGGGGGSSAGTSAQGNSGSGSGSGGAAVSGGGAGGSTGTTPAGLSPGGGGAGGVPSGGGGGTASSPGGGAAGSVSFSWSGGETSPVAGDIVRFLLDVDSAGAADGAVLLSIQTYGTVATLDVVYHTAGSGSLELIGYNSSSAQVFDSGALALAANGTPLYVSVQLHASGSVIDWSLSAIEPGADAVAGSVADTVSGSVGYVSDVVVNPNGTAADGVTDSGTAIGWITVQTYADTLVNLSPIVAGYAGELASQRIARLCSTAGIGFELVGQDSDTPQMGPQQDDTFLNVLQSCADADRGQLFETRDQFGIGYRTRVNMQGQSPGVIAYYAQAMLGAVPQPVKDEALIRNDITVTRSGGASATATLGSGPMSIQDPPNGVGDYTYALTAYVFSDSQLANMVGWMLTVGTVNEYRFPVLTFNMARSEVASLFGAVPGLDIGDFVQVPDPPSFLQNYPINQLSWGFTETLNAYVWTIAINAVPESPYSEPNPPTW